MFSKEEKEFLIRLMSEVKVNPLSQDAVPLISLMQDIASKLIGSPSSDKAEQGEVLTSSKDGI